MREWAQIDEGSRVTVRGAVRWMQLLEALGGSVEEAIFSGMNVVFWDCMHASETI